MGTGTHTAYIGLGSNLESSAGTPQQTVEAAICELKRLGALVARSSLYQTAPVGYTDQPPFVNAVVALRTGKEPEALLHDLLQVEKTFGRDRVNVPLKGPRTLDLDLLLVDEWIVDTPALTLPHPALAERRFVLAPLVEIAPDLIHPRSGKTMRALLEQLPDEGENRIADVRSLQN